MSEGLKTFGAPKKMCNFRSVSLRVKRESHKRVGLPTVKRREDTYRRCYGNEVSTEYVQCDQDK